jgi:tetratricopeptide (TPR) repeat protein
VRRRPAAAGLLAVVGLLVAAVGVSAWQFYLHRTVAHARQAKTDQKVREVMDRARGLLEEGWLAHDLAKLTETTAEGNRAADIARSGGASAAVRQEAEAFREDAIARRKRAQKNRALLEAILDVSAPQETNNYARDEAGRTVRLVQPSVDEQYAAAFRRWGLDVDGTAEAEVVARLGREPDVVVQELIAGLDAWMLERRRQKRPEAQWQHLFRVAERLDSSERHRQLRAWLLGGSPLRAEAVAGLVGAGLSWPALWELARCNTWRGLREVRREIHPRTEPVLTVMLLAEAFASVGDVAGAEEVLYEAVTARPDQVLLLTGLAKLLEPTRLDEAIGYYHAARGQRHNLGVALSKAQARAGRARQGEDVLQELALQQPDNPAIHFYLGVNLWVQKKFGEAEAAYGRAIDLKPDTAEAHNNLGVALFDQGRHGNAEEAFRRALALKPDFAMAHYNLGNALNAQRKHGAAEAAYRKAVALQPDYAAAHNNLGGVLSAQQKYAEAEATYGRAVALKSDYAEAHNNLATVLMMQARFHEAGKSLKKVEDLLPATDLRLGGVRQRRQLCQRFVTLDARLPALLLGTEKPADAAELMEFAQLCNFKKLHAAAARLYADAFTMKPQLAEELRTGYRMTAACTAALVGCGRGEDAADLSDAGRARWRAQARQWLRADLDAWAKKLDSGRAADRALVQESLAGWRKEPYLAGLRDPDALAKLPPAERQECHTLWSDLDTLVDRARSSK